MGRVRKSDNRVWQDYTIVDNPGAVTTVTGGSFTGSISTITDEVSPGFFKRIKQGEVILNPVTRSRTTGTGGFCSVLFGPHGSWGTREITADFAAHLRSEFPSGSFDSDTGYMKDSTLLKAYAKVDEDAIMGLVNLKELDQTIGMLRRPLSSVWTLLSRMAKARKRRLGKTAASAAKATANTWLEYRYGWMPLILDIKSIMAAAEKIKQGQPRFSVSRSGAKAPERKVSVAATKTNLSGMTRAMCTLTSVINVKVSSGVIYRYKDDSDSSRVFRMLGLRIQSIPTALWEIIPYSFVVDWFLGVGDWILAVTPKPNVTFLGNWTTVVDNRRQDVTNILCQLYIGTVGSTPAQTYSFPAMDGSGIYETYTREVNRQLPNLPQWKGITLSAIHSVDAISLSLQRILPALKRFKH